MFFYNRNIFGNVIVVSSNIGSRMDYTVSCRVADQSSALASSIFPTPHSNPNTKPPSFPKLSSQNVPPWSLHIKRHHSQNPEQPPPHSHPPKPPTGARARTSKPATFRPNQMTSPDSVAKEVAKQTEKSLIARTAMAPMTAKSPQKESIELAHPLSNKSHPPSMA